MASLSVRQAGDSGFRYPATNSMLFRFDTGGVGGFVAGMGAFAISFGIGGRMRVGMIEIVVAS